MSGAFGQFAHGQSPFGGPATNITGTARAYFDPNGLGEFVLGQSYLGTVPPLNIIDTVASQYANSPRMMQLIWNNEAYFEPNFLFDNFYDWEWNVETAIGYGLDVLGRIVGVNRVIQISSVSYFGFTGTDGASGLPWNQAVFYAGEPATSNYALSDAAFRAVVEAKAMANVCDGSIAGINAIMRFLFGASGPLPVLGNCYCQSTGPMTMEFVFGSALTAVQESIVYQTGVLPVPAGVNATVVVS
jgi:hypothetical protein